MSKKIVILSLQSSAPDLDSLYPLYTSPLTRDEYHVIPREAFTGSFADYLTLLERELNFTAHRLVRRWEDIEYLIRRQSM